MHNQNLMHTKGPVSLIALILEWGKIVNVCFY